jgi:hypothetical protein
LQASPHFGRETSEVVQNRQGPFGVRLNSQPEPLPMREFRSSKDPLDDFQGKLEPLGFLRIDRQPDIGFRGMPG